MQKNKNCYINWCNNNFWKSCRSVHTVQKKQSFILPKIIPYLEQLDTVSDEEIEMLTKMLDLQERKRLEVYLDVSKEKISNKRIFLYLCNLIDFKEIDNLKIKKKK